MVLASIPSSGGARLEAGRSGTPIGDNGHSVPEQNVPPDRGNNDPSEAVLGFEEKSFILMEERPTESDPAVEKGHCLQPWAANKKTLGILKEKKDASPPL